MDGPPFRAALRGNGDRVLVDLLVSAGAAANAFPDRFDPWRRRIGIRVRAPASGDRANREVVALVAAFFARPQVDVVIARGRREAQKTVAVSGLDVQAAMRRLGEASW